MPSDSMATIQKLYEVCKVSVSEKGPMSPEAVDNVRAVLEMIRPSDVGLECEAQAVRFWKSPRAPNRKTGFHSGPAIRYRHIYECKSFSIGIFCIPASSIIPLHNHPGMTVLSKLLYGAVHVKSYDWIDTTEPLNLLKVRPAKVVRDGEMSAPCGQWFFIRQTVGTSMLSKPSLPVLSWTSYHHLTHQKMEGIAPTSGDAHDQTRRAFY